jgi:hypothetical protein
MAGILSSASLHAVMAPKHTTELSRKEYRHPNLYVPNAIERVSERVGATTEGLTAAAGALGVAPAAAFVDVRSGRFATLLTVEPLIPGTGDGNSLSFEGLGVAQPEKDAGYEPIAWNAFAAYLIQHKAQLGIDMAELKHPSLGINEHGAMIQIHVPRFYHDVRVLDSYLTAVINHGNLVLLGANKWGPVALDVKPRVSEVQAGQTLRNHVLPAAPSGTWKKAELAIVALSSGPSESLVGLGHGYDYRLVWVLRPEFAGEIGRYEAQVDARSGELISFLDTNDYQSARKVVGGVYPVSNDNVPPDGVEQPGSPMPFADLANAGNNYVADTGGNSPLCLSGAVTTTLAGPFVKIADTCGAVNESNAGDIDLGAGPGTDCVVPAGHSVGDTHASRTGFYELNKIKEQARGQLPNNVWLQQQVTANMNLNQTCNAFWDGGAVNFFKSGGGCSDTGEIAGIFDHEWGHGLDDNDVNGDIANSGEATADIYMTLRLKTSCTGRNFFIGGLCGGYGDPCTAASGCSGVRDMDFAHHQSGLPADITFVLSHCGTGGGGPCNGEVHCEGEIPGEAVWDLYNRDLPSVFGMSTDTALEVAVRDAYLGMGLIGNWYGCTQGSGGCPANSGYMNFLAADDDNGNLNDGTPHMQALFQAFDRHGIGCTTPVVQNTGCPNIPTGSPTVTATARDRGTSLSWSTVPNAVKYRVYRTEGALGCNFGKVLLGETFGTTFEDNGLQNGRQYFYTVAAVGLSDTCLAPLSSCTTSTPVAGANLNLDVASVAMNITSGDGDIWLDNCENATVSFSIANTGNAAQTNVRINAVQPLTHPAMPITGQSAPTANLASCANATQSFNFKAVDLVADDPVRFRVDVTSDQLFPAVRSQVVQFGGTEGNSQSVATHTFDFETNTEGWTTVQGTFNRTNAAPGGAGGAGTFYYQSSALLDNQCDEVHSPVIALSATSALTLFNNFDIEPETAQWYDRANIGRESLLTGERTYVQPSGGRTYNATGGGGTCGTDGQNGWADQALTWASSTFTAADLGSAANAGKPIRLDFRYGTDAGGNGQGFRFDQLTLTNYVLKVADTQTDTCTGGNQNPIAVPDTSSTSSHAPVTISVLANDSDPDGNCLRVTQVTTPAHGAASINFVGCGTDTVFYVPNLSCGSPCNDSFNYTVSDGQGGTATTSVTINQTPVELQGLSVQ